MKLFRQGDVALVLIESGIPKGAKEVEHDPDGIVLAYGEATGHKHLVVTTKEQSRAKLWDAGAERFLQVLEKTALRHEEHAPVELDPGIYRVVQQREYGPEEIRNVSD